MPFPIGYVIVGLIGCIGYLLVKGKKQKVFISYYSKGDSHYKNLIVAWANNNKFELNVEDVSTDTKIKSKNTQYLKRRMRSKIEEADFFIVFVGKDTHQRDWVVWEIEEAKKMEKNIIAVKEKRSFRSPKPLLRSNVEWVYGFSEEKLRKALESF